MSEGTVLVSTFVIQHHKTKLYLGKATKEEEAQAYRRQRSALAIGASGHYRWRREVKDAIHYTSERDADRDWFFVGQPWIDFVDVVQQP